MIAKVLNEIGTEVPPEIIAKAKEYGSIKAGSYVYKDGEYGEKKFPASSIGGTKATRFKNMESAEANKVVLDDGWVAFKSPTYDIVTYSNEIVDRISQADPTNVQVVAASQIELLDSYHNTVINQSNRSFLSALVIAILGILFFFASVAFILYRQSEIAIVSIISGAFIEVISGIIFYLYGKTSNQLSEFHNRLDLIQRYLLANSVCEGLDGEFKQKARSELVKAIGGSKLTGSVHCNGEAEYFVEGTSFCKQHKLSENNSENIFTDEYFKILEEKVNGAINEGCASNIKFYKYGIYQTKYMQKIAETRFSLLNLDLNVIFFIAAVGVTFSLGAIFAFASIPQSIGTILNLVPAFIIGISLLGLAIIYVPKRKKYIECNKIMLNAERRIQELSKERK